MSDDRTSNSLLLQRLRTWPVGEIGKQAADEIERLDKLATAISRDLNRTACQSIDLQDQLTEARRDLARTESARVAILAENTHYKRERDHWRQQAQLWHDNANQYLAWYSEVRQSRADEPGALNVAPIARVRMVNDMAVTTTIYVPGLPDGEHDLFPVPLNPAGEMRPAHEREPPHCPSCSCGMSAEPPRKSKFDLAHEIMRQLEAERMDTMQSCHFGYVLRVEREGSAQPPSDALTLLREWLCASDNFDMDAWNRKVRNLVEDAPQFFCNEDGDIDFGSVTADLPRDAETKETPRKFKIGDCVTWGCNRKGVVQGPADEGTRVLVKWQGTEIVDAIEGSELFPRNCEPSDRPPHETSPAQGECDE